VVEELRAAGMEAHLAEPADTRALRGPKRRAKTDRADARLLRDLLAMGRLPESWIPPEHLADLRTLVRLRKSLMDERTSWLRRMHAQLFHHGLPTPPNLSTSAGRAALADALLPPAGRHVIDVGLRLLDQLEAELNPRRPPGPVRSKPAGLSAPAPALRRRNHPLGHDSGRARRHPAVLELSAGGPIRRYGRDRRGVRWQARSWSPLSTRFADVAMGALRGGGQCVASGVTRPRVLRRDTASARDQSSPDGRRPSSSATYAS
jgi:hypothetical protein